MGILKRILEPKQEFHPVHGDLNPPRTSHIIKIFKIEEMKWLARIYNTDGMLLESCKAYDSIRSCRVDLMRLMHAFQNGEFKVEVEEGDR